MKQRLNVGLKDKAKVVLKNKDGEVEESISTQPKEKEHEDSGKIHSKDKR